MQNLYYRSSLGLGDPVFWCHRSLCANHAAPTSSTHGLPLLASSHSRPLGMWVQGVQNHINGLCADLGKSLKKELQESAAVCLAQFKELCNQLADKKAQITAKTEMYQQA